MKIFSEIKERWNAEVPAFFVKVKKFAISVGGTATAIWVANTSMSLSLPEVMLTVCKYAIVASVAAASTAQLTKQDPVQP